MQSLLFVAAWLFVATHLDTLVVLVAFCADEDYHTVEVLIGHYLGFIVGLVIAIVAALAAAEVLHRWTFLLGVVPLGLGLWSLVQRQPDLDSEARHADATVIGRIGIVTATGIGLSGENIAVFVPFFARLSTVELSGVVIAYLGGAGIVFIVALIAARRTVSIGVTGWIDRWLVPVVLTLVGMYVLVTGWLVL